MQFVCLYIVFFNLTPSPLCFEKNKSKFLGPLGGPSLEKKKETRLPRKEDYTHLFKGLEKEEALTKAWIKTRVGRSNDMRDEFFSQPVI